MVGFIKSEASHTDKNYFPTSFQMGKRERESSFHPVFPLTLDERDYIVFFIHSISLLIDAFSHCRVECRVIFTNNFWIDFHVASARVI